MHNPVRSLYLAGTLFLSIAAPDALQAFTVTDYGVTIDRVRAGSEIVHCFCIDLFGTDIAGATITSPPDAIPPNAAYALAFNVDEDQWDYDEDNSAGATESKFPDGTYRFDVTYTDDSTETIFVELNRAFPPIPVVLSFDSDALTWEPWDGLPNGLSIEVYIEAEDESSHECDLPTGATSCALPPGFVETGSMYFVDVLFLSGSVPHAFTNSGWFATLPPGPFAAGRVPDGAQLPGEQLILAKGSGDSVSLSWGLSCVGTDTDYAVYSGPLSSPFDSHTEVVCTTGRATTLPDVSVAGSRYFLVVPHNTAVEGSYGTDNAGTPRLQGSSFCFPQDVGSCE